MTWEETVQAMRRVADAIENRSTKEGSWKTESGIKKPILDGECAVGAALFLCYLRDLLTVTTKESFDRAELLVLLETISRDSDMFAGSGAMIWGMEDEDEEQR